MGCCSNEKEECGCETKNVKRRKISWAGVVFVVIAVLVIVNWQ